MQKSFTSIFVALGILTPLVFACDSQSGSTFQPDSLEENESVDNPAGIIPNRGLQGYLATIYNGQLWKTDFPSGEMSKFPRVAFDEDPIYHNLSRFQLDSIGQNSSGFLLGVASCYLDSAASLGCVQFLDRDGTPNLTYYFNYQISIFADTVVVSNDGSRFAAFSIAPGRRFLTIYSNTGKELGSQRIDIRSNGAVHLDWGVDNVLYMSRIDQDQARIYYWNPEDTEFSGHYEFEYEGHISAIKASPVERKIAFELVNSNSSIYIADLVSGEAYRLVQPDDSFPNQFFTSPVWSPDGSWILAQHHNEEAEQHGLPPYSLIAIPAHSRDIVYDLDDNSANLVPFKITDNSHEILGPNSQTSWFRGGTVFWLAD